MPTEIPSWLLECGQDKGDDRDPQLRLSTLDLTQATGSMPAGFALASGYYEDNPVETIHSDWAAEPIDPPLPLLNVASVVIDTGIDWGDLADGCGRVPLSAVEEKLSRYRQTISGTPTPEATMVTVAGLPAIQQGLGLSNYGDTGYWLFTQTQLLHVYCQWTGANYRSALEGACLDTVTSLQVSGA